MIPKQNHFPSTVQIGRNVLGIKRKASLTNVPSLSFNYQGLLLLPHPRVNNGIKWTKTWLEFRE